VNQAADFTADRLVIRGSRLKSLGFLVLSAGFVGIFIWTADDLRNLSWHSWTVWGVAFFGLCALIFLAQLIVPGRLVLDQTGFTIRSLGRTHTFRWADIQEFFPWSPGRGRMIGFNFKPGRAPKNPLVGFNHSAFGVEAGIPGNWAMPLDRVVALLNEWRTRYGDS
jgi:hypothetical protein